VVRIIVTHLHVFIYVVCTIFSQGIVTAAEGSVAIDQNSDQWGEIAKLMVYSFALLYWTPNSQIRKANFLINFPLPAHAS
jgi:hypothetical protein